MLAKSRSREGVGKSLTRRAAARRCYGSSRRRPPQQEHRAPLRTRPRPAITAARPAGPGRPPSSATTAKTAPATAAASPRSGQRVAGSTLDRRVQARHGGEQLGRGHHAGQHGQQEEGRRAAPGQQQPRQQELPHDHLGRHRRGHEERRDGDDHVHLGSRHEQREGPSAATSMAVSTARAEARHGQPPPRQATTFRAALIGRALRRGWDAAGCSCDGAG